jgi:kynurenine 3-monooxygenase
MSASAAAGKHITIVGAGLVGSLLACYLARAGARVRLYERRPDPRARGYAGGRSINLALSARGLWGLAGVGLDALVMERDAIPMRGRMIHPPGHPPGAPLTFQPYSANPADAINSVSRAGLNLTLIAAAAGMPGVELHFDHPCVDVDLDAPAAVFDTPDGGDPRRVESELVFGADGAFSAVRARLQKTDRFDYSQSYLAHGYKELHIPPAADLGIDPGRHGGYAMETHALHIWPRGGSMMIALPNRDRSFTCTLFWPMGDAEPGEHGLTSLRTPTEVRAFFERHYPDAVPLMPTLEHDYLVNPNGSLVTVRCFPWQLNARVALIGDAAHAIVPFYGQGMNAGFEDCRVLDECLKGHRDLRDALDDYQSRRKPSADAIADMAIDHFLEMRDKVGRPEFLYKKKLEQAVHSHFPGRFTPQYNLVSFSTVPYEEARRRGAELDAFLERLMVHLPPGSIETLGGPGPWDRRVRTLAEAALGGGALGGAGAPPPAPIDLTPAITERLGVWPGDTPLSREILCDLAKGDPVTLSTIRATVHLGAHADGPNHYLPNGGGIGEQPLRHYLGPCVVMTANARRGARLVPADLAGGMARVTRPRVLIRTGTFPLADQWNNDFAALSPELIDALADRGVITIGIDTPSVDLQDSKDLPAHQAIGRHEIAILEGLDLSAAPDGEYELIALPLKLMGLDASPVRAVLRPLGHEGARP